MNDEGDAGAEAGQAARVADACARLGPLDRELVERVLSRGGRATLEEAAADPAAIARLERALGWFGFDPAAPRAGPQARVQVAPEIAELVASSVAGVPSLRRRPVKFFTLEARVAELHGPARIAALAGLPGAPAELEKATPRELARALARVEGARARARLAGESTVRLVEELAQRGGIVPLVSLPRDLREHALSSDAPLERAFLGEVGRIDRPCALLAAEVYRELACDEAPSGGAGRLPDLRPGGAGARPLDARPLLQGALLAVFPALALAREGELRETRKGALEKRTRERLAKLLPAPRELAPAEDEPELFARALVAAGLLESRDDGLLGAGPAALAFARGGLREKLDLLLRGYAETAPSPGESWPAAARALADRVREELLELEGAVPPEVPGRLAVYRWLAQSRDELARSAEALELDDLVALASTIALPAAEAAGLVQVESGAGGSPARIRSTEIGAALRAPGSNERCAILSADGEAVVLPLPSAPEAALLLSRVAELASQGEVLRFRVTATSVRGAQARPDELEALLARLRELSRGDVPESFDHLLRDAGAASVRARASVLRVLEVPRVAFADRAARVLGDLVVDRLTPTLLVLREPLSPADRRALAREGVFVDP